MNIIANKILIDLYEKGIRVDNIQINGEDGQILTMKIVARCTIDQIMTIKVIRYEHLAEDLYELTYELFPFIMQDGVILNCNEN